MNAKQIAQGEGKLLFEEGKNERKCDCIQKTKIKI